MAARAAQRAAVGVSVLAVVAICMCGHAIAENAEMGVFKPGGGRQPPSARLLELMRGEERRVPQKSVTFHHPQQPVMRLNESWVVEVESSGAAAAAPYGRHLPNFFLTMPGVRPPDAVYRAAKTFFVHLHKCGGISVRHKMEAACASGGDRRRCVMGLTGDARARVGPARYVEADFVLGGYTWGLCEPEALGASCGYFALFRDPVLRMISDYEYCTRGGWEQVLSNARLSRGDYLCTSLALRYFNSSAEQPDIGEWAAARGNHMLELFVLSQGDIDGAASMQSPALWTPIEYRRAHGSGRAAPVHADFMTSTLVSNLALVGLTERFAESMFLWEFVFGATNPGDDVHANRNPDSSDKLARYSAEELAAVREAVALDQRLYDTARQTFDIQLGAALGSYAEVRDRLE